VKKDGREKKERGKNWTVWKKEVSFLVLLLTERRRSGKGSGLPHLAQKGITAMYGQSPTIDHDIHKSREEARLQKDLIS